jgi:hypothetical protein
MSTVNIQGEHSGEDTQERWFEEKFDPVLEVVWLDSPIRQYEKIIL